MSSPSRWFPVPWSLGQAVAAAGVGAVAVFSVVSLTRRLAWERDNVVELCVDGGEAFLLAGQEDSETRRLLADFREAGVSSVGLYWNPSEPLRQALLDWAPRLPEGLEATLRPEGEPFSDWPRQWAWSSRLPSGSVTVRNVLFAGPTVLGYPDLSLVETWLGGLPVSLPVMEFQRQRGMGSLAQRFASRVVRGHTVTEEEMAALSPDLVARRFRRAVVERGARFLYVRLFPGLAREPNVRFVSHLARELRAAGFQLGPARRRWQEAPEPYHPLPDVWRLMAAFLFAALSPVLLLYAGMRQRHHFWAPLWVAGGSAAAGLAVAALLSSPPFALGFSQFHGVKAAFLFPFVASFFLLYRREEWRPRLSEPVSLGRLAGGGIVLAAVAYILLRTGHGTVADASPWERTARTQLELWFGVRPRFKEFLFGHPILWAGFYLRSRLDRGDPFLPLGRGLEARVFRALFQDARPYLLVGLLAPASIVNTFCHAHAPLALSVVRTLHGVWIGALLGACLIGVIQRLEKRWVNYA